MGGPRRGFPEIVAAVSEFDVDVVLDGELVLWHEGRVEAPSVAPNSAAAAELPDAGAVRGEMVTVLRVMLEVLDERRPIAQLDGVVAPSVRRYLRAARPGSRRVRVSRLMSAPSDRHAS